VNRLRIVGRNVACYFGLAEDPDPRGDAPEVNLLVIFVRVAVVLTVARLLQHVLGLGDGFVVSLAVVLAVAVVAGLAERLVRQLMTR
jgi:hypothetical protein